MLRLARASSPSLVVSKAQHVVEYIGLTKNASCVQVSAQELAVALEASFWRQAVHICASH